MEKSFNIESASYPSAVLLPVEAQEAIRHELAKLMASAPFRGSQQCRSFLSYVVTHTLSGDDSSLRERVIGNSVFGRPADYDTGDDPVVRIRASEVRKRLAQYYQSIEQQPAVTIQIPSGSYRVTFLWDRSETQEEDQPASPPMEHFRPSSIADAQLLSATIAETTSPSGAFREEPKKRRPWKILFTVVAGVVCLAISLDRYHRNGEVHLLQEFWQPFLNGPKPVLISIGSNAVYRISDEFADRYSREHNLEGHGMEFFPEISPDATLRSSGIHPAADSFVALGDVAAISDTVSNLTKMHKPFQERFSNDISFAELRSSPTVLIGGFNNPMTRELTRNFRFVFASRNRIEDHQEPGKPWILQASQDSHDTEDYAIISRVLQHGESAPLISLAGLGQYGTLAATEFVFDPAMLKTLERSTSGKWRNHNVQILIRVKVTDFKPVSVSVVSVHVWG